MGFFCMQGRRLVFVGFLHAMAPGGGGGGGGWDSFHAYLSK